MTGLFFWKPRPPQMCNSGKCRENVAPRTSRTGPNPTKCPKHLSQQKRWREKYNAQFQKPGMISSPRKVVV